MRGNQVFPSNYLKSEDLGTARPIVTIREVRIEDIGDDHKPVAYFAGKEKGLVVNKTNWSAIEDITGEMDSDDWVGKRIQLFATKTEYQGKRVACIRVEAPVAAAPAAPVRSSPRPAPRPAPEPAEYDEATGTDDPVPF